MRDTGLKLKSGADIARKKPGSGLPDLMLVKI